MSTIMDRAVHPDVRSVPLVGLPLAMVTVTAVFLFFSLATNSIRAYVKFTARAAGLDDYLALFSQVAFIACLGTTIEAALGGIGTRNDQLNDFLLVESQKWYFMWIIAYLLAMVTLKTAVCVTLLRILPRSQTKMRLSVWVLLGICWSAWAVDFMAVLLLCQPVEAAWDPSIVAEGRGRCGPQEVLIVVSHLLTAASVVTDIGCTVLPGIMLWKTQMHKTSKLEIFALLSIASVASVATIVRAPYFARYASPEDDLSYWCGYMLLYSNIEMGIGLFASSLPAVRRLYRLVFKPELASGSGPTPHGSHQLAPLGRGDTGRDGTLSGAEAGKAQTYRPGNWERLADDGSDKGILINAESHGEFGDGDKKQIRVQQTFEVASHNI